MAQSIEHLSQETQEKILDQSLEEHGQQHMPIPTYCYEMEMVSSLLKEHASVYKERLNFDITSLSDEINRVQDALLLQNIEWNSGERIRDAQSCHWYENKNRLYELNKELSNRLHFHFFMIGNEPANAMIDSIGISVNDGDAIYDGDRFKTILEANESSIAGNLYSSEEIVEMIQFYDTISESRAVAELDRSAPHHDRILRDKIYLHLRSLEKIVTKAADAAFVHDRNERSRYVSSYRRKQNRATYYRSL